MQAMNSVVVEGNLTRDPVCRETPKGNKVTIFSIASNRYFGTGDDRVEEVSFFDVEAWNKLGEACFTYLKKGRGVRVAGRLKQDRWSSPEGDPRSRVKVVAKEVDFKPQIARPDTGPDSSADTGGSEPDRDEGLEEQIGIEDSTPPVEEEAEALVI